MKTTINKLPKSEIEIGFEVPLPEWQDFLEAAAKELSKNLKIEGFRPGFAPFALVEERAGLAKILETAAEISVRSCYIRAISENNIEAIGQPEISITKLAKDNPFEFKARVAVLPEVKLADYRKIAARIKRNKISIEEKEIENALIWLQKSRAKISQKSGICQKGDWIEISYSSFQIEQGKELEDGFILGEGRLISGFEENLEGMAAGSEKEFSLMFPKNHYLPNLAEKKVDFKVKMKSVQKMELPEINDNFARSLGDFTDLKNLKENIKAGIVAEKELKEFQRVCREILEKTAENSEMEMPAVLIAKTQDRILTDFKKELGRTPGTTFENYLVQAKQTERELWESFSPRAEKEVKESLVLSAISEKEGIRVSDEEIREQTDIFLRNDPGARGIEPEKLKSYTKEAVIQEKTLKFLENLTEKTQIN